MTEPVLLLATGNPGKAVEIRELLEGLVTVQTLADYSEIEMPPEIGDTFAANALAKAEHVSKALNVAVIADDSGLVVDALDGAPGVHSARYAPGSDADRTAKVLSDLDVVPDGQRSARFVCAMAFVRPGEAAIVVEGVVEGRIIRVPRGDGGFGYDPIFELPDRGVTTAELTRADKAAISHRGQAIRAILPHLATYFSLELDGQRT